MLQPSKPLSISAIKTTGTLVVLCTRALLCSVVVLLCVVVCKTICKGMCTLKRTEKRVILFTPLYLLH
jgi:hypothetical protein